MNDFESVIFIEFICTHEYMYGDKRKKTSPSIEVKKKSSLSSSALNVNRNVYY